MDVRRNTYQRDLIRTVMNDNFDHPTADEIYELVRKIDSKISRGTVYRNLKILVENNEIIHYHSPFGPDHYDSKITPHYHCLCKKCGKLFDSGISYQENLNKANLSLDGFKLEYHDLVFVGVCKECNEKNGGN